METRFPLTSREDQEHNLYHRVGLTQSIGDCLLYLLQPTLNSAVDTYDKSWLYGINILEKNGNPTIKLPEKSTNHTEELITRDGCRYQSICGMYPETEQEKNHICGIITKHNAGINPMGLRTLINWCQGNSESVNYQQRWLV